MEHGNKLKVRSNLIISSRTALCVRLVLRRRHRIRARCFIVSRAKRLKLFRSISLPRARPSECHLTIELQCFPSFVRCMRFQIELDFIFRVIEVYKPGLLTSSANDCDKYLCIHSNHLNSLARPSFFSARWHRKSILAWLCFAANFFPSPKSSRVQGFSTIECRLWTHGLRVVGWPECAASYLTLAFYAFRVSIALISADCYYRATLRRPNTELAPKC